MKINLQISLGKTNGFESQMSRFSMCREGISLTKDHRGDDVIGHCEGARDPAAMPGLNRKKSSEKKSWKIAPISSLGYGASKEKEIKKPRSLAKISVHFFTIFSHNFFFDSSQAWLQGHVLLHSDLWRHLPMILCETYPFPAHRKSRHLGLKTVSFSKANLQIYFHRGSARV